MRYVDRIADDTVSGQVLISTLIFLNNFKPALVVDWLQFSVVRSIPGSNSNE
jgi:hypothetical protein